MKHSGDKPLLLSYKVIMVSYSFPGVPLCSATWDQFPGIIDGAPVVGIVGPGYSSQTKSFFETPYHAEVMVVIMG